MSEEAKDETVEDNTVDYSQMTEKQLAAKQTLAETEIAELRLKAEAGEAVPADTKRFTQLRDSVRHIKEARAALSAMLIDDEVAETPTPEAPAPVAEAEAPTVEVTEVAEEQVPVLADINTDKIQGTGPVATPKTGDTKPQGPAILASLDGSKFTSRGGRVVEATNLDNVASKLSTIQSDMRINGGVLGSTQHIMTIDKMVNPDAPRAREGSDIDTRNFNSTLVHGKLDEAVMADCRNPVEFETDEVCAYRTDTPFYDLFPRSVDANACSFEWKQNLSLEDLAGGNAYWDACKQAAIDPADESTWKPIAELPSCEDECYNTAEAFYTTWGLRVTVDNQFCRADRIQEANNLLAAYRAIELDNIARAIFDGDAGNAGNVFAADLSAFGTDLGLVPALQIAIAQFVNQTLKSGRFTCAESGYFALIPDYVRKHVAIDLSLAGENAGQADAVIRDAFSACGISDVRMDQDWGCEGNLSGIPEDTRSPGDNCVDWNCVDTPLSGAEAACPTFGSGSPLVPLTDRARIRIGHTDAYAKGSTSVVDYELRQDNSDLRKNQAIYFGESREFFFGTNPELAGGILDLTAICPSGNRIDRTASVDCAAVVAAPAAK